MHTLKNTASISPGVYPATWSAYTLTLTLPSGPVALETQVGIRGQAVTLVVVTAEVLAWD